MSLMMICTPLHQQRGVCLLLLVARTVLECVLALRKSKIFLLLFYSVLVWKMENVLSLSFFSLSFCFFFLFCGKLGRSKKNHYSVPLFLLLSLQIITTLRFYQTGTFQRVTGDSFGVSLQRM